MAMTSAALTTSWHHALNSRYHQWMRPHAPGDNMAVTVSPPSRFLNLIVTALLLVVACSVSNAAASTATPKSAAPPSAHKSAAPPAPAGKQSAAQIRPPRLEDFIAESGSTVPFMLHADLWQGIDQRAK